MHPRLQNVLWDVLLTPEGSDRVPTHPRILHDMIALLQENKIRKLDENLKRRDEIIIKLKQKQERQIQRINELKRLVMIASNAEGKVIPVLSIKNFDNVVCGLEPVKISEISGKDTLLFKFIAGGKDILEALEKEIAIWNPIQSEMSGLHEYRICEIKKIKK